MKTYKAKASDYNSVNTECLVDYIARYNKEIIELLNNESAMLNTDRAKLKSIAAELETAVKQLKAGRGICDGDISQQKTAEKEVSTMTNTEKTLDYFRTHENKLEREVHRFLWEYAKSSYVVDLYFYPDTKDFYAFANPGGNSWLNDNHITIYSYDGEYQEIEKGRFREFVNEMTEIAIDRIFDKLEERERQEQYYGF